MIAHIRSLLPALALLAALLAGGGCRKRDIKVKVIHVPGMRNAACARIIQDALSRHPPEVIRSVEPDIEKRTVTVTYNSMVLALKNLEYFIAAAGFDANDTVAPSNAVCALPPECREDGAADASNPAAPAPDGSVQPPPAPASAGGAAQ